MESAKSSQDKLLALTIGALGVVFGDIGTSPLYALRECFTSQHGLALTSGNILGVVSLLFWMTLILIVSVKYVLVVMRADNRGEGGILALMALVMNIKGGFERKHSPLIISLGILGGALLYGDGVITPAITVLGAIEGLNVATSVFKPFVMPLSLVILIALFLIQSKGTAKVGALFGPILLIWFAAIGILGLVSIIRHPGILAALNPLFAVKFLIQHGRQNFAILGSIFLAVTGAEMLYADLGHFGRKPIRLAWFALVLPGLILNYFGQGAFLLSAPPTVENLFFLIAPAWLLYPLVALATVAAIIASQAVISGAFSLARQNVQLGFWPRIQVRHTSASQIGQVYAPFINWCLLGGVILLILTFKKSTNLAAAYGIAVSATMLITTVLIMFVARRLWSVPLAVLIPLTTAFLVIDSSFFSANIVKIKAGGWIVLVIALMLYILMKTWLDGREILRKRLAADSMNLDLFLQEISPQHPMRVPGIAVFLSGNPNGVPGALLHNLKHNKILHEHTVILSVKTEEIPYVDSSQRVKLDPLGKGMYRILLSYGFSETPNIPATLKNIQELDFRFDPMQTTFFLGRESLIVTNRRFMAMWRKRLFWFMSHNAQNATNFFHLPPNRVVELGVQIEL